jgi:acylphosphatase
METFYFCLKLTENEHDVVEGDIIKFAQTCDDLKLVYYRKLKDGHVAMIREVKLQGSKSSIKHFKRWVQNEPKPSQALVNHVVSNPYKVKGDGLGGIINFSQMRD